jgi:transposase-like protein
MTVMDQEQVPERTRRSFSDEFKRDAVAMVLDEHRRIIDVARSLGVGDGTLGNWVRQQRTDRGDRAGLTTTEKAELAELRKVNAQLRMERDLLKRATAFWVKESGQ